MTPRKLRAVKTVVGLLAFGLVACGELDQSANVDSGVLSAAGVTAGGVTVDVVAVNPWQGGFQGALRITNVSFSAPITSFQVVFSFAGNAGINGTAWNGSISGSSGNRTATNPAWLQYSPIRTGQTWEVGFNGSGTFSGATIVSLKINGQDIQLTTDNPPTVSLSASASTITAPGSVTLTATASDDKGVSKVEFLENGAVLRTVTSSPYTYVISYSEAGTHTYTARATDTSGQTATSTAVVITVKGTSDNPPTVTLAASSTYVTSPGSITLTANASDDKGVTKIEFLEGTTVLRTVTTSSATYVITYTAANNGTHTYTARATDTSNQTGTSSAVQVVVDIVSVDNPPTATLSASSINVTAPGSVTLTASASDDKGVTKLEFLEGTTVLNTVTTSSATYVISYSAAGTHTYTARATDTKGQTGTSSSVVVTVTTGSTGMYRVDSQGHITKNGTRLRANCGSWFGLQGRYEPASDSQNPRGAPMELYMGNTFWANNNQGTGRTIEQTMKEITAQGMNLIRMPVVHQTLSGTDPQGMAPFLKNHSSVRVANSRLALEQWIKAAAANNLYVLLDIHSCSNYVDWRKGRLDARPPWVDKDRNNYDYKREEYSCASDGNPASVTKIHEYNESIWLEDLKVLAGLSKQLGVTNIIGIDIYNEPWDYSWQEWKTLIEDAYAAIDSVNPDLLIFAQGIGTSHGNQDGTPLTYEATPFGDTALNANWGENLYEAGENPPNIPKDRLVFSPHTYGPSVFVQKQFLDPSQTACVGLEGDAAGDAKCQIVIDAAKLEDGWEQHFGYLRDLGYAVVVGEFGGNLEWPGGQASNRDRDRWKYLTDKTTDAQWQTAFINYMVKKDIEGCYWSVNPESGDTGGWYGHAYDPVSNTGGWGEWKSFISTKTSLLKKLWGM